MRPEEHRLPGTAPWPCWPGRLPLGSSYYSSGCQQRGGVAGGAVPPVHLQAWREEEQEREEGYVQEEAMYRTKTLPGEEQESEQERKDYAMLFPFSELFANLVQEEQFEGKEEKEQEQEVSKDSAPIHDACYLLQRLLLHAGPSSQRCREVQEWEQ